ncbi:regulator of chromosome condensation (RCC1) repeat-containing protein [Besnoitia besnoiti]|uniref:Regulator of chromosome condensation (RCC1) repeat-containing protein n=1 Tax=Besnoitia besnoiti TaxID=94643 RepID=A0A2A9MDJ8_BESBE|nr:regulator of chromosome condensation (RCC1) repeat-containing protein [Besnoitia besnoiti]PFH34026.1 regulator of chromosome condensation (RCC1) repeat-containing protein [Besnoitia besnoiti]
MKGAASFSLASHEKKAEGFLRSLLATFRDSGRSRGSEGERRFWFKAPGLPASGVAAAVALLAVSQSRPSSSERPLRASKSSLLLPPSRRLLRCAESASSDAPLRLQQAEPRASPPASLSSATLAVAPVARSAFASARGPAAACAAAPSSAAKKSGEGAKKKGPRQQILFWGDKAAIPGGAASDFLAPTEISWFGEQAATRAPWRHLSFGPAFGVALNEQNEVVIWGSFSPEEETGGTEEQRTNSELRKHFISPVYLKLPFLVADAQCSAAEIFLLSTSGRVFILADLAELFRRLSEAPEVVQHGDDVSVEVDAEGTVSASVPFLRLRGLPPDSGAEAAGEKLDEGAEKSRGSLWLSRARNAVLQWTGLADRVVKMSVGTTHAAFVTRDGSLYCCGANLYGECGVEPRPLDEASLHVRMHRVDFSNADVDWGATKTSAPKIADVSCGLHHTLCLSKEGKVYAFGDDSKIQLGLGDTRSNQQGVAGTTWMERLKGNKVHIPRAVSYSYADRHLQHSPVAVLPPSGFPGVKQCTVTAVAAGDDFSLLLFQDNHQEFSDTRLKRNALLCCGETAFGQCGRTLQQQQQVLSPVVFPRSASAVHSPSSPAGRSSFALTSSRDLPGPSSIFCAEKVACGSAHCLALMSSGKLVGWGFNAHGQVGAGGRVKGAVSPPRTIAVDAQGSTGPSAGSESSQGDEVQEGKLAPPLARYLSDGDGTNNLEIRNVFCKFNSSAAIRAE